MSEFRRLMRLAPSAAVKEKKLAALLAGRGPAGPDEAERAMREAEGKGSLELAALELGSPVPASWGGSWPRARRSVDPQAPFSIAALRTWHRELTGADAFRKQERPPRADGPPAAPVPFIESRLEILQEWMQVESGRELKPGQQGALVLVRLVEIAPFDGANGTVSRMAASHVIVRGGGRPPLLNAGDAERLAATIAAAFRLDTEPLTTLLDEASERSLDVVIAALETSRG
jgi:hypothetical protein